MTCGVLLRERFARVKKHGDLFAPVQSALYPYESTCINVAGRGGECATYIHHRLVRD